MNDTIPLAKYFPGINKIFSYGKNEHFKYFYYSSQLYMDVRNDCTWMCIRNICGNHDDHHLVFYIISFSNIQCDFVGLFSANLP